MDNPERLAERLGNVRHFMTLSLADRLSIILAGQLRLYSADTTIFSEEETCSGMFVLLKGHVHICKLGPQGHQTIIADIEPVIMFNEVALLDGGPNPYTAIATQNCLAWHISHQSYQRLLKRFAKDQYMQVALGLLDIMASRYRQLLNNYADLSFLTVPVRVAKLIYELSNYGQDPIDRRKISISEMAARISTVPEAISRALNFLRCQGIIQTTRTKITILLPDELEKFTQVDSTNLFVYGHKYANDQTTPNYIDSRKSS